MTETNFPATVPIVELRKHSPEYHPKLMRVHRLLYVGGKEFADNVELFLTKRAIEQSGNSAAAAHYAFRKDRAWYINRCSGLIDWLVAEVRKNEPRIVAKNDPDGYWESLNNDADGYGRNLSALVGKVLTDIFLHRRGYFGVHFPDAMGKKGEGKSVDAKIRVLCADSVRDWEADDFGNLKFCRVDTCEPVRVNPWTQPNTELHRWTFFTDKEQACYEKSKPISSEFAPDEEAQLNSAYSKNHDLGTVPVFPAEVDNELWVLNKIEAPLRALYNRECATTFALESTAYQMLVLKLEDQTKADKIVASELAALKLGPTESVDFVSPDSSVFEPLFKDAERLKQALYEVLQTLAANALATQTQNARQAAEAKQLDLQPMSTLLQSYAWPVRNALEKMIEALKKHRGEEDNEVRLEGLDEFEAEMEDAEEVLGVKKEEKKEEE